MITLTFPTFTLINEYSDTVAYLSAAEGLLDAIGASSDRQLIPGGLGEFEDDDPEYPGLTFTVFAQHRVDGGDWRAFHRKVAALAQTGWFDLGVTVDSESWFHRVRVEGRIIPDLLDESGYIDISIPLLAPDPRRYGPARTTSTGLPVTGVGVADPLIDPFTEGGGGDPGRVTVTNNGTTDTVVTFTVTGGMSEGCELTRVDTGQRLRLEWPIAAGNTVLFDPDEGQVWLDGQSPISGYLTRADWWALGPGETVLVQFAALGDVTGTPTLTATWRDADA